MRLEDKLNKANSRVIKELFYSCYQTKEIFDKDVMISKIIDYYTDLEHYPFLFTDGQVAFLESELDDRKKKKLFKAEIKDLKDRFFIGYNSKNKSYELFDELVEVYHNYTLRYTKEQIENFGLYRYLLVGYVYAYGAIREEEIEELFGDLFDAFDLDELLSIVKKSNYYQGKINVVNIKGDTYYCINDPAFSSAIIDLRQDEILEDFAPISEEALSAYYYDGYDSTNQALLELTKILDLPNHLKDEFYDLIIFTYALMQPKTELTDFVLRILRYDYYVSNEELIHALELEDDVYHTYGSWVTKGYSQAMVEQYIEENIQMMNKDMEEEEEIKEEPIN